MVTAVDVTMQPYCPFFYYSLVSRFRFMKKPLFAVVQFNQIIIPKYPKKQICSTKLACDVSFKPLHLFGWLTCVRSNQEQYSAECFLIGIGSSGRKYICNANLVEKISTYTIFIKYMKSNVELCWFNIPSIGQLSYFFWVSLDYLIAAASQS